MNLQAGQESCVNEVSVGGLRVVHLHWVLPPGQLQGRRVGKETAERPHVKGGRHDHYFEVVRPPALQLPHQPKQNVGLQRPLVGFVQHDGVVAARSKKSSDRITELITKVTVQQKKSWFALLHSSQCYGNSIY